MSKPRLDQVLEFASQLMGTLRRQVESEDLDRHEAIALRFVRTKHRPQSTGTDLMKYSKWTEGVWRTGAGNFRVQLRTPQGRQLIVTQRNPSFAPIVYSSFQVQANSSELSARVPVDVRRLPGIKRLAADYAYAFGALAPFFAGDPSDRAAWADAVARPQSHQRRSRELAPVLRAQQQRRGAPPAAVAAAERLADPRTRALLPGQAARPFRGPPLP